MFLDSSNFAALEGLSQEFDNISSQLSSLDRYTALHTWDMDPAQKKALVNQRVELVMKLDAVRVARENLEAALQSLKIGAQGVSAPAQMSRPYYPELFTDGQAASYIQGFAPSAVTPNGMLSLPLNFQQTGLQAPMFEQCVPQYAGLDMTNSQYSQHQAGFAVPYPLEPHDGPNIGQETTPCIPCGILRATTPASAVNNNGLEASMKPGPDPISNLQRRIEEAARRGESIEPYMRELGLVYYAMAQQNAPAQQIQDQQPRREQQVSMTVDESDRQNRSVPKSVVQIQAHRLRREQSMDGSPPALASSGRHDTSGSPRKNMAEQPVDDSRASAQLRLAALNGGSPAQTDRRYVVLRKYSFFRRETNMAKSEAEPCLES
jgi:hypothetical protein